MAKKKKKRAHWAKQKLKSQKQIKQNQQAKQKVASASAASEKRLVVTKPTPKNPSTTFSKKLEEVIAQNETLNKKGLLGGRIILLNAPIGYTKEEWKKYLKKMWHGFMVFLVMFFILAMTVSAVIVLELLSDQRVLPRISLAGVPLGYMLPDEAKSETESLLKQLAATSIDFRYADSGVNIHLSELEAKYLPQETFNQLPRFDFHRSNFLSLVSAELQPHNLSAIYQVDYQHVYRLLEQKLGLTKLRAHNAQFYFDEKKKLKIKPEQDGIMIDPVELKSALDPVLAGESISYLNLPTIKEFATVKAADLQQSQSDLQLKLENEITLNYGKKSWKFKPENHLEFIDFDKLNNQVVIKVSPKLINQFFQKEVFADIEKPVSNLKISYDATNAKAIFEGRAINGLSVDREQFVKDLEASLNSFDHDFDIVSKPVSAQLAVAPELQEMGIKDVLSIGHTAFAGSPTNRRHNIATAMARFNGLIIKPNDTFSFDDNLGAVDGSTGYKLELVIKAEGTVPEFGGGVCQVSSTMFKAALLSGLPIVERAPHSYAVGYYAQIDGFGLDSTIYPGVRDLKFINDTGNNILIQTFIDGDNAYINFYGSNDGRQVKLENYWRGNFRGAGGTELIPTKTLDAGQKKQIESAHGGFDASWDRVITKNNQDVREKIYSVYRATSNRILVGQ